LDWSSVRSVHRECAKAIDKGENREVYSSENSSEISIMEDARLGRKALVKTVRSLFMKIKRLHFYKFNGFVGCVMQENENEKEKRV